MRLCISALLLLAAGFVFTGCSIKQDIIRPLSDEHQEIYRRLDAIDARLIEYDSARRAADFATRADLGNQLSGVDRKLDLLSAKLEDYGGRFGRGTQRVIHETTAATRPVGDGTARYNQAYSDYTRGSYDLARQGFQDYLKSYPASDLADNAQYWLGECFYDQGKYDTSQVEFRKVVEGFPESEKAPAALYKIAKAWEQLGEKDKALAEYRLLVRDYPLAPEAKLAEENLK